METAVVRPSPWWYRRRDMVFGLLYGFGFAAGGAISSGMQGGRYVPLFVQIGGRWGSAAGICTVAAMFALMIACFAVRVWGSSYLHARVVWSDNARTDSLVIAGPFRYVRNPLYFGNILMALSIGALGTPAAFVSIVFGVLAFVVALVKWEEPGLHERFGSAFDAYCKQVPSLMPRLTPIPACGRVQPSLREGLRSEIFTGALLAGMIALFTVGPPVGIELFAALYVAGIVGQRLAAGGNG